MTTTSRSRPHVVGIIPRGEAIRNFVHTGCFDEVARHAELTILSVAPTPEMAEELRTRYGRVFPLEPIYERWPTRFSREILDLAHGRWLWSKAAEFRWNLRDAEASGSPSTQMKRMMKKALCLPFANRMGLEVLSATERAVSKRWRTSDHYLELFRSLAPSLVFNASHIHSRVASPAVEAARWLKIPTAAFVFSWDNLTSQGRIMPSYDYYLVWNDAIKRHLLRIYKTVKPEQVFVTGTPQFDFHFRPEFYWTREEFCRKVGADPARPIVLYSTGMANQTPGEPVIVERIAKLIRQMREFGPPQLLVRVYPKDRTDRFERVKRENPDVLFPEVAWEPNWLTPQLEDAYTLTNTLRHAAAGINIGSTVSLELCMFDKPVINVAYNPPGFEIPIEIAKYYDFDHYKPVVESGAVWLGRSEEELVSLLRRALTSPHTGRAERRKLVSTMFGTTLDGYAGWRAAERIVRLAATESVFARQQRLAAMSNAAQEARRESA